MNEIILWIIQALWFILPAYIANPTPVIVGGKTPLDFNRKFFDNNPIFGKGKTWRGTFFGILAGTAAAYIQIQIQSSYDLGAFSLTEMTLPLGFLLSSGAIIGDITKSFLKRRINIKRGSELPLFDQLDFIIGALIFASFVTEITLRTIIILVIITPVIHRLANILAYRLKLKNVPW
ncbi:MAG: CDP-2,3-bis-(O-geranylgeranyl)-sn-glycerol synthase [archaeon]